MARIVAGTHDAVKELCEALGIDPNMTTGITIDIHHSSACVMHVRQYLSLEQVEKLGSAIKELELTVKEV